MTALQTLDDAAARLCNAYLSQGQRCIVMRDNGLEVRVISPQTGAPELAERMHRVANVIFDGPATVERAGNC